MGEVIEINNRQLAVRDWKEQRVITFKDIDEVHGRTAGTAARAFYANRKRMTEEVDYFKLHRADLNSPYFVEFSSPNGLIVLTETGYLMLVKVLNDPKAWDVQRKLVDVYFHAKQAAQQPDFMAMMPKTMAEALRQLADKWDENDALKAENQALLPKAEFYDKVGDADGLHCMNEIAKLLGWGTNNLFAHLRKQKILCENPHNAPRQAYVRLGYFVTKERTYDKKGQQMIYSQTYVTPKGLQWLQKTLASSGKGVAVNA